MKRTPLTRKSALRRAAILTSRRRKPTGFPRPVVAQAIDRDQRCVLCGEVTDPRLLTGHHRINRGVGGSTDPETNSIRNCLAACWPCNGAMESDPDVAREARERGIKLTRGMPLLTPVRFPDGAWWVLLDNGQRRPAREAAA